MNKFRKLTALLMMVIVLGLIDLLPVGENVLTVDAATEVKMNKDKLTLYVGGSSTLKISGTTNEVKWSTTNKRVVKVSSIGKVTALNVGTATVNASVNNKVYKCKVTVKSRLSVDEKSLKVTDFYGYAIFTVKGGTDDDYVTFEVSDPTILDCEWEEWDGDDITLDMIPLNDGVTTVTVKLNDSSQEMLEIKVECAAGSIDKLIFRDDALAIFAVLLAPKTINNPDSLVCNDIYFGTLTENSSSKESIVLDMSVKNDKGETEKIYEVFYFDNEALKDRPSLYSNDYQAYVNYFSNSDFPTNFKTSDMKYVGITFLLADYYEAKENFKINTP